MLEVDGGCEEVLAHVRWVSWSRLRRATQAEDRLWVPEILAGPFRVFWPVPPARGGGLMCLVR